MTGTESCAYPLSGDEPNRPAATQREGRQRTPEPDWSCPKEGCDLDADGHDLALAMEHIYEIEPEAAQGAADRTIKRMEGLL